MYLGTRYQVPRKQGNRYVGNRYVGTRYQGRRREDADCPGTKVTRYQVPGT